MSEYIPLEVQDEILKRLPLKSLIQFRSVSKTWKSLIDSPKFSVAYGVRQTNPNRLILRYRDIPREERYFTFVDNHTFIRQDIAPSIPDLVKKIEPFSKIIGSSHGLLCLDAYYSDPNVHETGMVVLWNPSIRKSIGIEVPFIHDSPNLIVRHVIGFGVCPVTLDPIILRIEFFPWEVGVYTLNTGTWSILSPNFLRETISFRGSQVVIDRFIYWYADGGRSLSVSIIMSFDLTAKQFKEIYLPDSLTNRHCIIQSISRLRESLVLLECHAHCVDKSICCLWMMEQESFTKLYTIDLPDKSINKLLGFKNNGELIMETQEYEENAQLEIYEPNSEAIDNLGIDGDEYSFFVCSYMETLLLLDQIDGFIYSKSS